MNHTYDVAVISGGHNGLPSGCQLTKGGLKVIDLEQAGICAV